MKLLFPILLSFFSLQAQAQSEAVQCGEIAKMGLGAECGVIRMDSQGGESFINTTIHGSFRRFFAVYGADFRDSGRVDRGFVGYIGDRLEVVVGASDRYRTVYGFYGIIPKKFGGSVGYVSIFGSDLWILGLRYYAGAFQIDIKQDRATTLMIRYRHEQSGVGLGIDSRGRKTVYVQAGYRGFYSIVEYEERFEYLDRHRSTIAVGFKFQL